MNAILNVLDDMPAVLSANPVTSEDFLAWKQANIGQPLPEEFKPHAEALTRYVMSFLKTHGKHPDRFTIAVATYIAAGQLLAMDPDITLADVLKATKTADFPTLFPVYNAILDAIPDEIRDYLSQSLAEVTLSLILGSPEDTAKAGFNFLANCLHMGWWIQRQRQAESVSDLLM